MKIYTLSRITLGFLLIIGSYSSGLAQQWNPIINITNANIQQLSPTQLDFQNFQSSIWLFTIDIIDPAPIDTGRLVKLDSCTILISLRNGDVVNMVDGAGFNSDPFLIIGNKKITNLDFGREIQIRNFKLSEEARKKIVEPALASGKFPSGNYTFKIGVYEVITGAGNQEEVELNLESYSQIELRYPLDGETTNEFPLFEWFFEGNEVEITINEKKPEFSKEEAINRYPVVYNNTFSSGEKSFQYPVSGVRPLEKGKTYVWKAVGKIKNLGGEQLIYSPIYQFTVKSDIQESEYDALLEQIEKVIEKKYGPIIQEINKLELKTTGSFLLNRNKISFEELLEILEFLKESPDNIQNVTLE